METFTRTCSNPWCKAHYTYTSNDIKEIDGEIVIPMQCPKCVSFATELSGGVVWTDKTYEGSIYDDGPQQIRYKVTNYRR